MIATAYLRVYLPAERSASWPPHHAGSGALLRHDGRFLWSEPLDDDAFVAVWRDRHWVCPRFPRLRMLEGVIGFSNAYPALPLLADDELAGYAAELHALREAMPHARSHILHSPWHVPVRWFAAFHPDERELYRDDAGTSIRYRASLGDAVDRVGWAVRALGRAGMAEYVVDELRELEHWLCQFTVDAMVELDYARVADLFHEADLVLDESAADVRASLMALERGRVEEAGERYVAVASRWSSARALTFSN